MSKRVQWVSVVLAGGLCLLRCGAASTAIDYDATPPDVPERVVQFPSAIGI